jgi:hypothetical protein
MLNIEINIIKKLWNQIINQRGLLINFCKVSRILLKMCQSIGDQLSLIAYSDFLEKICLENWKFSLPDKKTTVRL